MKRIRPVPGTAYDAGVQLYENGRDRHDNVLVVFRCHCGREAQCRFTQLRAPRGKRDQQRSCGCLKKVAFKAYWRRKASKLTVERVREIFEVYEVDKRSEALEGLDCRKYLANFAWQRHRKFLAAKSFNHLGQVHDLAQKSPGLTSKVFGYTHSEVLRICKIVRKRRSEAAAQSEACAKLAMDNLSRDVAAATIAFGQIASPVSWTGSALRDSRMFLNTTIPSASSVHRSCRPEFSLDEFSVEHRRSDFGSLFLTLRGLTPEVARAVFGPLAEPFIDRALMTLQVRRDRRAWAIEHSKRYPSLRRKRAKKASSSYAYLPEPLVSPRRVGQLINEHASIIELDRGLV